MCFSITLLGASDQKPSNGIQDLLFLIGSHNTFQLENFSSTGVDLALDVLDSVAYSRIDDARNKGRGFFNQWLKHHIESSVEKALEDRKSGSVGLRPTSDSDTRWVGLALLIALTEGDLDFHTDKRNEVFGRNSAPKSSTYIAITIFADTVHRIGMSQEDAPEMFSSSISWWTGSKSQWNAMVDKAQLIPISRTEVPESGKAPLVIVFKADNLTDSPSSRLKTSSIVQEACNAGHLAIAGFYKAPEDIHLSEHGFKK